MEILNRSIMLVQADLVSKRILLDQQKLAKSKLKILVSMGKNAWAYAKSMISLHPTLFDHIIILQGKGYSEEFSILKENVVLQIVDHPIPSINNFNVASDLMKFITKITSPSYFHFIITGGTSSCFSYPEDGIDYTQYTSSMEYLLFQELDIFELNEIRSVIDRYKGGKLSILLDDHYIDTSVISDVLSNDPSYVGSGPTIPGIVPSISSRKNLDFVARKFGFSEVISRLSNKLSEVSNYTNSKHDWNIIASNEDLCNLIAENFGNNIHNYTIQIVETELNLEVMEFATYLINNIDNFNSKKLHVWSGELKALVDIKDFKEAEGGRLSLFSYYMAKICKNIGGFTIIAFATDGRDGNSPVSCYIIDENTYQELANVPNYEKLINTGNTGRLFANTKFSLETSSTNVNFADLIILIKH
ncbi:MAG: DUF4147 domain-containing protein [Candidatus Kariarchaeaceae archaeon]